MRERRRAQSHQAASLAGGSISWRFVCSPFACRWSRTPARIGRRACWPSKFSRRRGARKICANWWDGGALFINFSLPRSLGEHVGAKTRRPRPARPPLTQWRRSARAHLAGRRLERRRGMMNYILTTVTAGAFCLRPNIMGAPRLARETRSSFVPRTGARTPASNSHAHTCGGAPSPPWRPPHSRRRLFEGALENAACPRALWRSHLFAYKFCAPENKFGPLTS